jgi:hypothetical protein
MKATLLSLVLVTATFLAPSFAQDVEISGTWSGSWIPKGGVRDAVTIELQQESGKLAGRFRTPAAMEFNKASFNAKTGAVVLEAFDEKSGKRYKIDATAKGTELKGTLSAGDAAGELHLIKWTFFGR